MNQSWSMLSPSSSRVLAQHCSEVYIHVTHSRLNPILICRFQQGGIVSSDWVIDSLSSFCSWLICSGTCHVLLTWCVLSSYVECNASSLICSQYATTGWTSSSTESNMIPLSSYFDPSHSSRIRSPKSLTEWS